MKVTQIFWLFEIILISIQEWIKRKQLPPKNTDESEKEAEKRKADELRQLMAQVVITVFNYW